MHITEYCLFNMAIFIVLKHMWTISFTKSNFKFGLYKFFHNKVNITLILMCTLPFPSYFCWDEWDFPSSTFIILMSVHFWIILVIFGIYYVQLLNSMTLIFFLSFSLFFSHKIHLDDGFHSLLSYQYTQHISLPQISCFFVLPLEKSRPSSDTNQTWHYKTQ